MHKTAIKKFAKETRRDLIERVSQRALKFGITPDGNLDPNLDSVNGYLLSANEKSQRAALIAQIEDKGYEQTIEEVAYTWFNRFIALRFMEVNNFLPSRVRVFTDEHNAFKPQILSEAIHLDLEGLDVEKVYDLKESNSTEELYKYLLITQCNALNAQLPGMFQKIVDYTELLLPDNLLREGSVLDRLVADIQEDDWKDAVQIIGWLYQYYNTEKKDDVFAALKKNVKISKDNIPAATQLFTPDWIVRYMVENSLGRLWVEGHPDSTLSQNWNYYVPEAAQEPSILHQLDQIRSDYQGIKPQDILCIDPCSGSGHVLAYMFDVLVQIYESYGVDTRSAVASIVQYNIHGLDIDERAAQLAYFAVMMKACQYDRRFLRRNIQPKIYHIVESNHLDPYALEYFCDNDPVLQQAMHTITEELFDAKEYGSIISVSPQNWDVLYARFDEIRAEKSQSLYQQAALELESLVRVAQSLSMTYHCVVTNPPYMGSSGMDAKLASYVKDNYKNSKSDLFAVFIEKGNTMIKPHGFNAMVTMQSWMFLSSFENFRKDLLNKVSISNLMHMDNMVMRIAFGTAVAIFRNDRIPGYKGSYNHIKLEDIITDEQTRLDRPKEFPIPGNRFAQVSVDNFKKIPGSPIAYWASDALLSAFESGTPMGEVMDVREGMTTADNNKFIRLWHEVDMSRCKYDAKDAEDLLASKKKWVPYNKGGARRQWYGNYDYLVNWYNDGYDIKHFTDIKGNPRSNVRSIEYHFYESITWSLITSGGFSIRYRNSGGIHDVSGKSAFADNKNVLLYALGLMSTKLSDYIFKMFNPTINLQVGDFKNFPVIFDRSYYPTIEALVEENIALSKLDWDQRETSWDFVGSPLLAAKTDGHMEHAYEAYKQDVNARFERIKENEEALNRIFIDIYGLNNELDATLSDRDVTVAKIFDTKQDIPADIKGNRYVMTQEDVVKNFISYFVGCLFGRYSLDTPGLVFAGGTWDESRYTSFPADKDNIIPICDDEYFEDDIVGHFVQFVATSFGADTLSDNLAFIANALGGKGSPKQVLRAYFLSNFYADHCKMYQKRPIYWMFDSGKYSGFKCLMYIHRYQTDTLARIRTDYVHETQARYRASATNIEARLEGASSSDRVKLNKQLKKLSDQSSEILSFEERIHHLADQMIGINLDDGVKENYKILSDCLAKIK